MDNFEVIYYINLEHRVDRKEHILSELSKFKNLNIVRINAVYDEYDGHVGCLKSHILALEQFVKSDYKNCLILEDDFTFTKDPEFVNDILNKFFKNIPNYDVLMLSANVKMDSATEFDFVTKILDTQTASGYSVNKNYSKKILNSFNKALPNLIRTHDSGKYACDMCWKVLQPCDNWYCLKPKIGKQLSGYSDISKVFINHNV